MWKNVWVPGHDLRKTIIRRYPNFKGKNKGFETHKSVKKKKQDEFVMDRGKGE